MSSLETQMETFKKGIDMFFGRDHRYEIPLFQRSYVWSREYQWEPLWSDIKELADSALHDLQNTQAPSHFMGAVVIRQRDQYGDELPSHEVIDGQQRLTTFQILLAVVRDIAVSIGAEVVHQWCEQRTINRALMDVEREKFKVWPTARDNEQFRLVMTAGSRFAIEGKHPQVIKWRKVQPRPRMVEAYLFFHDSISTWLVEEGLEGQIERAQVLRRVLDQRIQFVSIELARNEDPQAIFETLNARGVPLLASDLLRNDVFSRAGSQAEALHAAHWSRFEIPDDEKKPDGPRFWEIEERQGRLTRARLDLFLQHYLSMKVNCSDNDGVREIVTSRLFQEYQSWRDSLQFPFETVQDEVREFGRYADIFFILIRPGGLGSGRVGRFLQRLRALETSTAYPLVLFVLGDESLPESDRDAILVDLESFLVRRLVCERTAKNYNRLFLQILRDFYRAPNRSSATFRSILAAGMGESVGWPDDSDFERAWNTVDAYTAFRPWRVEMLLRAIEDTLPAGDVGNIVTELTVEHLMPQAWEKHWPLPESADSAAATELRSSHVHDIGNLTLLTQRLNSELSNGPASDKLPAIALQSRLALNAYFQGRTTWTEDDIRARGCALFELARAIWPGPPPSQV